MRPFSAAIATLCFAVSTSLFAGAPDAPDASDLFPHQVSELIGSGLGNPKNRLQITIFEYVSKLTGCVSPEPFLPYKVSTSGRATVGVKCQGREQKPLYLTVNVKVFGRYWVPNADIARGQVIEKAMLSEKDGDLSKLPRNIIQDPEKIIGKQLNRALKAGKPVQESSLQAVYLVKRNAIVDVQAAGTGFMIKRDGKALDDGALGDPVRVKLQGGNTVKATVTAQNVLNIDI